jgi:hypothetical protein
MTKSKAVPLTEEQIRQLFVLKDGLILWAERSADFCAATFQDAHNPAGLAESWAETYAGTEPRWKKEGSHTDFACTALKQTVPLLTVCQALGADYAALRAAAVADEQKRQQDRAKAAVLKAVSKKDSGYVWKKRTAENYPKTDAAALAEFNARHAGRAIRPRYEGKYKIGFHTVTSAEMADWLTEE